MSKQGEVPEGAVEALRDAEWAYSCSPIRPDRDSVEWAEMRLQAVLPLLYKHFSDRLLSKEAVAKALAAAQDVNWDVHRDRLRDHPEGHPTNRDVVRAALKAAALQATPTPEVDHG